MRILYVTTVSMTMAFFVEHIRMLQELGYIVELACNIDEPLPAKIQELGCVAHHIPFSRTPLDRNNLLAYRELKRLLLERLYNVVHTHTPNASAIVRLACRTMRREGMKVFYTAHGFHFYKEAPLKNWVMFYPVEWICSHWTDVLITITKEDYARAKKFKAKKVIYIPGVGLDISRFENCHSKEEKRKELGIPEEAMVLLTVGELNKNKNQAVVLKAMATLHDERVHYVLCGRGEAESALRELTAELGITDWVHFLGYRTDVAEIYSAADIYLCPSFREGLNVSIMEAMASGLPVICSDIRGNRDLIADKLGGVLIDPTDEKTCAAAIEKMKTRCQIDFGKYNQNVVKRFDLTSVLRQLKMLYVDDDKS